MRVNDENTYGGAVRNQYRRVLVVVPQLSENFMNLIRKYGSEKEDHAQNEKVHENDNKHMYQDET